MLRSSSAKYKYDLKNSDGQERIMDRKIIMFELNINDVVFTEEYKCT